jgi:hypothetical protein
MAHHGAECQECKYFVHARKNGRITRRKFGECTFVVAWPEKIPMNYAWRVPTRSEVWANSNAEGCSCFTDIEERR